MFFKSRLTQAYVLPFATFIACLALVSLITFLSPSANHLLLAFPEYAIYPIQTLLCAGLLIYYWREYSWNSRKGWLWAIIVGLLALILWLSPQWIFGFSERMDGFNPTRVTSQGAYYFTVGMRLIRLVIVVPLIEEIFWRGFLLRYLTQEDWQKLAFGECSTKAFLGTAFAFMLVHQWVDMPAAFLTGLLYNFIAVRTRSLAACVVAHAITNLGLGIYILQTKQWGFW